MYSSVVTSPGELLPESPRIAVAMGFFDGVHLGHQAILRELGDLSCRTGAEAVALFFEPHPRAVLFPPAPPLITDLAHKEALLREHGALRLVSVPFTRELSGLSPEEYLERFFMVPGLEVVGFCVGDNWRFGRGNLGGTAELSAWAASHGMEARIVPCVCRNGSPISSTRIRLAVETGQLAEASAMLGRPFSVFGTVCHGNGIGTAKLSCPTANLQPEGHVLPPFGVYAARACWNGRKAIGIVYVGEAPTIRTNEHLVLIELHLFDLEEDLYGQKLLVEFHQFIRPSIRFASPLALQRQIAEDIAEVRALFHTYTEHTNA